MHVREEKCLAVGPLSKREINCRAILHRSAIKQICLGFNHSQTFHIASTALLHHTLPDTPQLVIFLSK